METLIGIAWIALAVVIFGPLLVLALTVTDKGHNHLDPDAYPASSRKRNKATPYKGIDQDI